MGTSSGKTPPLSSLTGRQAAWIGAGYTMMFATMPGQTLVIGQYGAHIRGEFALSDGQFGLLYTAATLASAVVLVWAGGLTDRFSARRLALFGLAGLALAALGMAAAGSILALGLVLFGLRFFGQGMISLTATTMVSRWFNRFRGRALALSQLGYSTGGAILPFTIAMAIAALGWRQTWIVTALLLILVLGPVIFSLLAHPPDGKKALAQGLANPDAIPAAIQTGDYWTRVRLLGDPLFFAAVLGVVAPAAIGTAIIFHQAHLIAFKGWNLLVFTGSFPIITAAEAITALLAGQLVDRFGAWRLLPVMLLPLSLAGLVLWLGSGALTIPVLFFVLGVSGGAFPSILGALWPELYGTKRLGAIRALVASAMVLATAVGPGIVGVLIDAGIPLADQGPGFTAYCLIVSVIFLALRRRFRARAALGGARPGAPIPTRADQP